MEFESRVQYLKYQVLKSVAESYFAGTLERDILSIPEKIVPGNKPTMRCCVYKERAIVGERIKMALGGNPENKNVIEVIKIACDDCPVAGYQVTEHCRGCIAHYCEGACAKEAISFGNDQRAQIDPLKCVKCGKCAQVCPYGAIISFKRPCEKACKTHAIGMDSDGFCEINDEKCIDCGACVYQCPFGAIVDKSFMLEAIDLLKAAESGKQERLVAVIAPSIAVQYKNASVGQLVTALLKLGFTDVVEAALGADITASKESQELAKKGTLTSSCCPAFVALVKKLFPEMAHIVSDTPSPMVCAAMDIKMRIPNAKTIFIGPCIAKKEEDTHEEVKKYIDNVITFEEMKALFAAKDIVPEEMEATNIDDSSRYGRNFAESGGVATAVVKALREQSSDMEEILNVTPVVCNGVEECIQKLTKAKYGKADGNFFEGMACVGGCVNGPVSLRHLGSQAKVVLEKHSEEVRGRKITVTAEKGASKLNNN